MVMNKALDFKKTLTLKLTPYIISHKKTKIKFLATEKQKS